MLDTEIRMQERVFMGIGCKPFMDIKPSEAAICDRAINCAITGRGEEYHMPYVLKMIIIMDDKLKDYLLYIPC